MSAARKKDDVSQAGSSTAARGRKGTSRRAGTATAKGTHSGLAAILAIEERARSVRSELELAHLIANETRKFTAARQIFVLRAKGRQKFRVDCVSSVAMVEKDTPLVRWVEGMIRQLAKEHDTNDPVEFTLPAYVDPNSAETKSYPFSFLYWQPLKLPSGEAFAGLLLARERPWNETESNLIAREASAFSNAWQALHGHKRLNPRAPRRRWLGPLAWLVALVLACIPVPLTTLAPIEIIPLKPQFIAAPLDGVVKDILVGPNEAVVPGQILLQFDDTALQSRLKIADREMRVAQARYDRVQHASFSEEAARRELAIAKSEFELKRAEREFAKALLARTVVRAERAGILIYTDKERLLGRPVTTGQRLMEIASPTEVEARIDLPVGDSIVLEKKADVRLFLDSNPLEPVSARLTRKSYHAEPDNTQALVYRLFAKLEDDTSPPRIGARGTAQLQGAKVPLLYFLLRRPISSFRQYFGL